MRSRQLDRRSYADTDSNPNRIAHTVTYADTNSDANAERAFGRADVVAKFILWSGKLQRLSLSGIVRTVHESGHRRHNNFHGYNRVSRTDILLRPDRSQQLQGRERHYYACIEYRTVSGI